MAVDTSALIAGIVDYCEQVWVAAAQCMFDLMEANRAQHSTNDWGGRVELLTANDAGVEGAITYSDPKAEWTNTGTRPHKIFPVSAKRLVFEGESGTVFALEVNHPGTTGSNWFDDVATEQQWESCLESAAAGVTITV